MITSAANKAVRHIINLTKKASYRKETGLFIVEGLRMFAELPGEMIDLVFVSETFYKNCTDEIRTKICSSKFELVSDELFARMSDTKTPQGILASVKNLKYSLKDILTSGACLLLLNNLRDPGNLGTMFRAGEGAGLTGIVMDEGCVDVYNPKVIRSTMGSVFRIPFIRTNDICQTTEYIRSKKIHIYAATLDAENDYDSMDYSLPSAFLIGNEANGLSPEVRDMADRPVRIPMLGNVESLNAATAASVLLYELARQRRRG